MCIIGHTLFGGAVRRFGLEFDDLNDLADRRVAERTRKLAERFPPGDATAAACDELEAVGSRAQACVAA